MARKRGVKQASALRYDAELPAPIVILQASGKRAERAVELAKKLGIPVEEDKSLSDRLIFVEAGTLIPEDMYSIVAVLYGHFYRKKYGV